MAQEPQLGKPDILSIELKLAWVLRIGSLIAVSFLVAGLVLMFLGKPDGALRLITYGLITLLTTPIMRVLVASFIFVKEKDWHFAFFCFVVLSALAAGMLLGNCG